MNLTKKGYRERLIDKTIEENLKIFRVISIEGLKWCGKTWTALNHANSVVHLNNTADNFREKHLAEMNVNLILNKEKPELIMEMLLRSLARNESTISTNSVLIKDIEDNVTEEELNVIEILLSIIARHIAKKQNETKWTNLKKRRSRNEITCCISRTRNTSKHGKYCKNLCCNWS